MKIYDIDFDKVINGVVATGSLTYKEAIEILVPLINKTEFQRKLQDKKFYEKLEKDITKGCVMPPITLAFVNDSITSDSTPDDITSFFDKHSNGSFVLDGIQRLNTLSRIVNGTDKLDLNRTLYVNLIFTDNVDKLLYRMITLNNGQKPMTPRHQVEMLMANAFDFNKLGIEIQSEKERAEKLKVHAFNKSDIVQAYLAYMANSPMIDNKKIIEEKMDELIVNKIISSEQDNIQGFENVIKAISKFQQSQISLNWLKQANNLVGLSVGMRYSGQAISILTVEQFENAIKIFDKAFSDFNPSKIKLGKMRRELSFEYFKNFSKLKDLDSYGLLEHFSDITND